jgi:GNAT superfamily N-acetyltransferase
LPKEILILNKAVDLSRAFMFPKAARFVTITARKGEPVNEIRVVPVRTKSGLRAFIRFPSELYKDDPYWVPPLNAEVKERLDVRRIVAVIDRNHNALHGERIVFFGMYESVDDEAVARALLDAAAAWGRERGLDTLRGPVNLSLNDECAFLYDGYDSPPAVMMPYNPRYYHGLMEACGLVKAKDLYAFFMDRGHVVEPKVQAAIDRTKAALPGLVVRTFRKRSWREESEKIQAVYNQGWERNWGFVPWTETEMAAVVRKLKGLADMRLVVLAENEGRPVGFAFAMPNYNEILVKLKGRLFPLGIVRLVLGRKGIKGLRIIVFGIVPEFRQTGLSYLLYEKLSANAHDSKYEWCETSWQLEDNEAVNRFVLSVGGRLYKTYRIYERKIR